MNFIFSVRPLSVASLAKQAAQKYRCDAVFRSFRAKTGVVACDRKTTRLKASPSDSTCGQVGALPSDAHSVFITLTAKGLRPDIFIISRASDHGNEDKRMRAVL
jgi:hypothetical protein